MKIIKANQGGVLILTMMCILLFSGIVAVGYMLSSNQVRFTARSANHDAMQTTAEGLLDYAFGEWKDAMIANRNPLSSSAANSLVAAGKRPVLPQWMSYKSFTITALDEYGAPAASPTKIPSLSPRPKGWRCITYQYKASVTLVANTVGGTKEVSMESILNHDLIPPVGGLFYTEGDFELYKPAPMIIGGNVHTNANAYVSTHYSDHRRLRFLDSSNISFVGSYDHKVPPKGHLWSAPGPNDLRSPTYDRGYANQVSKTERLEGIGMGTTAEFNTQDNNPNNDGNREIIEPPVAGHEDPDGIADSRIYNNAGLVIEILGPITGTPSASQQTPGVFTGNNVKITAKNGTVLNATQARSIITALSSSETVTTQTPKQVWNSKKRAYEWITETTTTVQQKTVYDKREMKNVTVTDVDMGALKTTLNEASNFNQILYINNTAPPGGTPKAIRIDNGGVLPEKGLTVATEGGLYVMGDYNTGTTTSPNAVPSNVSGNPDGTARPTTSDYSIKPAALVADAVMFLSNSWLDANDSGGLSSRNAIHTTINSAIIAGYIPSGWIHPTTKEEYWYSGGMNNFPRFLENWSNIGMTFNGAFVQLFRSELFVGEWDTGDIYAAPNRRWSFDKLLLERVIPGIPSASIFSRGRTRPL